MADTKKKRSTAKNQTLAPGVYRFGRGTMYHKKGLFAKKAKSAKVVSINIYYII